MILKGSQRGGGNDLARHLMKMEDNEHVLIHELRGFAANDLKGAFQEAEAISRGTKCRQFLFSLSLSPPVGESAPVEAFEGAIAQIEKKLGLEGQSRAIVFHEKEGRRHAHCVWSRIDAAKMTAIPLPYFKWKLKDISRELFLNHGWKLPKGFENFAERHPTNFNLAEWQQSKRQGIDPRWLKQALQECWRASDDGRSLSRALDERGFFLAKGDKRSFVVLDHGGEVYSLPKMLGIRTKEIRDRLGDASNLPGVADTKKLIGKRMTPAIRRHIAESKRQFAERSETLGRYKEAMTKLHRDARSKLDDRHRAEWESETKERVARLPRGLRGLWYRITGKYQEIQRQSEHEAAQTNVRHARERQALIDQQLDDRKILQAEIKQLRSQQAEQLRALRSDIGRFLNPQQRRVAPQRTAGRKHEFGLER